MNSNLMRLVLSGLLVVPMCLTGVVTAYQFNGVGVETPLTSSRPADLALNSDEGAGVAVETPAQLLAVVEEGKAAAEAPASGKDIAVPVQPRESAKSPTANEEVSPSPDAKRDAEYKEESRGRIADREYFARLTVDGLLPGRIQVVDSRSRGLVPARKVTVKFVQRGKVVSEVRPGLDGFFQAAGLQPGLYTVVASGQDGMMTFGTEVLPALSDKARRERTEELKMQIESDRFKLRQPLPEQSRDSESFLQLDAVLVPPRDVPTVRRIMQGYLAGKGKSKLNRAPHRTVKPSVPTRAPVQTAVLDSKAQLVNAPKAETYVPETSSSWGTVLRLPIFHLDNGSLGGRLTKVAPSVGQTNSHFRIPLLDGSVYFVRNGTIVATSSVDEHGRFRLSSMPEGDYTFVAAGPEGLAAFGVSVMARPIQAARGSAKGAIRSVSSVRLVQQPGDSSGTDMDVDTGDPNDVNNQNPFGDGTEGNQGAGAGGMAGGGGGGAGGGGGGGGLGGLGLLGAAAGIGGAIAGGIALANENNNNGTSGGGGGGPPASNATP